MNILILAFALASPPVGGHEVGGTPPPPPAPVISLETWGGLALPSFSQIVTVEVSGEVWRDRTTYTQGGNPVQTLTLVATLAPSTLSVLVAEAGQATDPLVDLNAGEPYCTDAPWTRYSTENDVFYQWANCHQERQTGATILIGAAQAVEFLAELP